MLRKTIAFTAISAVLACGGAVSAAAAEIEVHGAATVGIQFMVPNEDAIEADSGLALNIESIGSRHGMMDLASGEADIAMISAPLDSVAAKVNGDNPGMVDPSQYVVHLVGASRVSVIVHPSNPVTSLTLDQFAGILGGDITNWKDVGGNDATIVVFTEKPGNGTRTSVENWLLDGREITDSARIISGSIVEIVRAVAAEPSGVSVASGAAIDDSVARVNTGQAIPQALYLVTSRDPSDEVVKVVHAAQRAALH